MAEISVHEGESRRQLPEFSFVRSLCKHLVDICMSGDVDDAIYDMMMHVYSF